MTHRFPPLTPLVAQVWNSDFAVTHRPPTDWEYADTVTFTFVDAGEKAMTAAEGIRGRPGRPTTIVRGDRVTHLVYEVSR